MPNVPETIQPFVTEVKEVVEAVVASPTEPVAGAEKSVEFGEEGLVHGINVVFVGDGSKTKWAILHGLGSKSVSAVFHTDETGPGIQTLVTLVKVLSANEIEVTLSKAPAAEAKFWITVQG